MTVIHGIIKGFCWLGCCWVMGSLTLGGAVPDDANPRDMAGALQAALKKTNELKHDLDILQQSMDTYIPFNDLADLIVGESSFVPNTHYDFLFVIANATDQNYQVAWLNEQKLHLREYVKTKFAIAKIITKNSPPYPDDHQKLHIRENTKHPLYDEIEWSIDLTKANAEELIYLMKQYRASNAIQETISAAHLPLIYRLFGGYAVGKQTEQYMIYGVDSQVFGIVFEDGFIPKNTIAFYMHSLFQAMLDHAYNVRDRYIDEDDVSYNECLNEEIQEVQLKIKAKQSLRASKPHAIPGSMPASSEH